MAAFRQAGTGAAWLGVVWILHARAALAADTNTFTLPATILSAESAQSVELSELTLFKNVVLTAAPPAQASGFKLDLPPISAGSPPPPPPPLPRSLSVSVVSTRGGLPPSLRPWTTGALIAASTGLSLANAFDEPAVAQYHFHNEGFFGPNTYAGGADKAAHFVDYTIVGRVFEEAYRRTGYTDGQSRWLAFATSVGTGMATEIGDGTTIFGFSWEDLLMDTLGAASSMGLSESGWDDSFGFRVGFNVSQEESPPAGPADRNIGRDYSGEIYTADVKIAGLARRLHRDLGPARFLLFSTTYGSNGYKNAPPDIRQRLVGFEIGIAFPEILRSLGVPSEPLWGEVLYKAFEFIRFPYTAIGVRYDLNHHQWFGPTTGRTSFKSREGRRSPAR
jgi:hypothetical protein